MMRKFCCWFSTISIILLMISFSFAQAPRDGTSSEGKSTFTNIAVRGLSNNGTNQTTNPGTPSYIEMTNAYGKVFYLYVDSTGTLTIASEIAVGYAASPATANWRDASGQNVGNQL